MKVGFIRAYCVGAAVLILSDFVWIGFIASDFYRSQLQNLMASMIDLPAALLFYFIYSFGIFFFAVRPNLASRSKKKAALSGALLGLVAYGTYDLSNQATLANWPYIVTIVDILWGMALSSFAATIAVAVTKK